MSFLSILLFASVFYFTHARPSWPIEWDLAKVPIMPAPSVPVVDSSAYQEQLGGVVLKMSEAMDQYMTPLVSQLDLTKQDKLKTMGMDQFVNYMKYLLLLLEEQEYENAKAVEEKMTSEFDIPHSIDENSPFVATSTADE